MQKKINLIAIKCNELLRTRHLIPLVAMFKLKEITAESAVASI